MLFSNPLRVKMILHGTILLALGLSVTGCATITRGTHDVFVV